MYHIKNDLRSQKSANRIYQSLRHILKHKNLKDITITDIYNECHISRMTFYRLFDNIMDVLAYKLNFFVNEYNSLKKEEKDSLLFFFKYWNNHRDLIKLMANDANYILKDIIFFNEATDSFSIYFNTAKLAILTSILSKWSQRNGIETPEEMKMIAIKILSKGENLILI